MANMKSFSDLNGQTTELAGIFSMPNAEFVAKFPGVKGKRYDCFSMQVGKPGTAPFDVLPVTRTIEYKAFASKHECDSRCTGATGKTMKCECSCGGKNHGRGH